MGNGTTAAWIDQQSNEAGVLRSEVGYSSKLPVWANTRRHGVGFCRHKLYDHRY